MLRGLLYANSNDVFWVDRAWCFIKKEGMNSTERKEARYQRRKNNRDSRKQYYISKHDDYENIIDANNLYNAFKKSKRGVSWKESIQRYEMNLFKNISEARRKLIAGEDVTHGFIEFDLFERGKKRHIKSVHISERIIQKALCDNVLVPIISRSLVYDNGASLLNKGLHFSTKRFIAHLLKYYKENGRSNSGYCLSIDFSKYFDSIKHDLLFKQLKKLFNDKRILSLTRSFINPFGNGISLGLGSQVSQILALFYPNTMDHYIKDKMQIKFYGRYMDDFYIIHRDKAYLNNLLTDIKRICTDLGITVNNKKSKIVRLKDGVRFLKGIYTLTETGRIVCRSTQESRKRQRQKLIKFKKLIDVGKMNFDDVRVAYQSWRGNYMKRFHAFHTIRRMDGLYNRLFINNH